MKPILTLYVDKEFVDPNSFKRRYIVLAATSTSGEWNARRLCHMCIAFEPGFSFARSWRLIKEPDYVYRYDYYDKDGGEV